jgi:hypothetical protein
MITHQATPPACSLEKKKIDTMQEFPWPAIQGVLELQRNNHRL